MPGAKSKEHKDQYDIFISYRQLDSKDTAMALWTVLTQRFRLRVFYDSQELDNLHDLEQLVRKSKCVVPIISAGYLETLLDPKSWCSLEIKTALAANIPLAPVYDPDKTGIPGAAYTDKLAPEIKPLFKVLFKPIRREGEYLDLFFKDLLRAAGQEDAWLRASGDPWAVLDCTPRTRYMFQASALRYEVASTLIKRLGLADIDDFKLLRDDMIAQLGLKPLELAKVTELVRCIKQGDWAHVTDADVLAGAYDDATPPPEDSPRTSRSSASNTSPTRLLSARQGATSMRSGSVASAAQSTTTRSLTPAGRGATSMVSRSERRGPPPPGAVPNSDVPGLRNNIPGRVPTASVMSTWVAKNGGASTLPRSDSIVTDATIVSAMGMVRVTSGDLAELVSLLSNATRPLTLDLANRTFSSASWRGVLLCELAGTSLSGGTIVLRPGQKIVVTGQDVLLEDLVVKAARPGGGASVHSHGVDSDGSTDEEDTEHEESDDEESGSDSDEDSDGSDEEEEEEDDEDDDDDEDDEDEEEGEEEEAAGGEEEQARLERTQQRPEVDVRASYQSQASSRRGGASPAQASPSPQASAGKAREALVEVRDSGVATLRRVTLTAHGKRDAALRVVGGGTVTALDCIASNTGGHSEQHVVYVSGAGCTFHSEDSTFSSCFGSIMFISQQATARLYGCSVNKSKRRGGVEVYGYGSTLQADTTQFNKNRNAGVAAHDGGAVQLETCALQGSVTSSGLVVVGRATRATAHNSQFKENEQAGAYVCDGAVLKATNCQFTNNKRHSVECEGYNSTLAHDLRCKWVPQRGPSTSAGALIELLS